MYKKCNSNKYEILPKCKRIIVIGDIHGDWNITKKIFLKNKLIDNNNRWIAEPKDTHIVQVGDILDRGGRPNTFGDECSELKIMDFLEDIHNQAELYGGGVFCLIGNHELMNVLGNFNYSGKESIKCFGGIDNRKKLFSPGGLLAKRFACSRNTVMKIGSFIFVHGGFNEKHLNKNINEINSTMKEFLNGNKELYDREFINYYMAHDGILWNRDLSLGNPNCSKINNILDHFKVNGIIVGHTVQENGINSKCDNKIWRVDTGMSNAFGENDNKNIPVDIDSNIELHERWNNHKTKAPEPPVNGGLFGGEQAVGEYANIPVIPTTTNMINKNLLSANPPPGATTQYPGTNRSSNNYIAMPGVYWYNDTNTINKGPYSMKVTE